VAVVEAADRQNRLVITPIRIMKTFDFCKVCRAADAQQIGGAAKTQQKPMVIIG
jgi:hypothetical protein